MKVIVTFEPSIRDLKPYDLLMNINCGEVVEWGRNKAIVDIGNCENALSKIRDLDYVSHVSIVHRIINRELDKLKEECKELLLNLTKDGGTFKVVVRRIDKKFPMTSIELAKYLGEYLSHFAVPDLENPRYYIYVEVREDSFLLGYSTSDLFNKRRESIPMEWVSKVVGIVEGPREVYETMDLIQLSHAFGVEIRLITNPLLLERAYKALRINRIPNVKAVNLDNALNGVDIPIVLSMYAKDNEKKLIEIAHEALKKKAVIGFILGNEYDDVSLNLRRKAMYEIRLGPQTGHPMRTTVALTYALSVLFTSWLLGT